MSISVWLRVIRVRFLLASVIAVIVAFAISSRHTGTLDIFDAVLTLAGVIALHVSVDLLNDYWDYKRGIDTITDRTKISGGTGVLPEGLLKPSSVYRAGLGSLLIGGAIGMYFVVTHGVIIAAILGFAILSIYFYSTKIVNSGLGEFFVAVKGSMIVLGSFYIQYGEFSIDATLASIAIGTLSSLVLFVASFPDYTADKSKGRRTLVIVLGKRRAARMFWVFPGVTYAAIITSVVMGALPLTILITLATIPLAVLAGRGLFKHHTSTTDILLPHLSKVLLFSRITGVLLIVGVLVATFDIIPN